MAIDANMNRWRLDIGSPEDAFRKCGFNILTVCRRDPLCDGA
jgi:hypothetical protein